jgi:hypothetical protein
MVSLLTAALGGFLILTVVYLLVAIYARSVERERLEKRWDAGDAEGERDAYVEQGMQAYEHSLRRRLILLVYIIPAAIVAVTVYVVNHN